MGENHDSYLHYLQSQHWSDLRSRAFDRANRKCEACSRTHDLRGHHLRYFEDLTKCTEEHVMALCERCHDLWHKWLTKNAFKVADFCRQSTRGGILVLLSCEAFKKEPKPKHPQIQKAPHLADIIAAKRNSNLVADLSTRSAYFKSKAADRKRIRNQNIDASQAARRAAKKARKAARKMEKKLNRTGGFTETRVWFPDSQAPPKPVTADCPF